MNAKRKATRLQSDPARGNRWAWGLLIVVLVLVAIIRIRLLNAPFERDEGEFADMGRLMLEGVPPYVTAYNMKLPGVYAAYALIMTVFGQSVAGVHLGMLLVNSANILLVFLLTRRLFGGVAAVAAAASYGLLATSESVLGLAGHATHFVVLAALGGTLLMLKAIETRRTKMLFWSGFLFGLSVIMKQPGVLFVVFGGHYLVWALFRQLRAGRREFAASLGLYLLGAAAPFAATCLILLGLGAFRDFWHQTFVLAQENSLTFAQGKEQFRVMFPLVAGPAAALWVLAGIGLSAFFWDEEARAKRVFAVLFLVFSVAAVSASFYFRDHYFIMMMPVLALLIGVAVASIGRIMSATALRSAGYVAGVALFLAALGYSFYSQTDVLLASSPDEMSRLVYHGNPFVESLPISDYIRKHSAPTDTIAVLGSEAQIYFYSHRRAATGYIYTYSLMWGTPDALDMQHEMARQIERARPKFIVIVAVRLSWLPQRGSKPWIFGWYKRYTERYYERVGLADIISPTHNWTIYRWGSEAANEDPTSQDSVFIYERKAP